MELETAEMEQPSVARGRSRNEAPAAGPGFVLGPKDVLEGKLTIDGDLRIQGKVDGELHVSGDLHVDAGADVKAALEARNVSVRGTVTGNLQAKKRLLLAGSGTLNGDVRVARLNVEDGATLNGNVSMGGPAGGQSEGGSEG